MIFGYVWYLYMGVSKNRGTPKWMVYFMENLINMDDLGVPLFLETSISIFWGVSGWSFLLGWGLLEVDEVFHLPP